MTAKAPTQPERTLVYQVTWWETDKGTLVQRIADHDEASSARVQYANIDKGAEPVIAKLEWDAESRRWNWSDLAYDNRTPTELANANAKGIAAVRAVIQHARGSDGRGTLLRRLDDVLADDNPAVPTRVTTREPLVTDDPATCIVCDYCLEVGLAADHPHLPIRPEQRRTDEAF